MNDPRPCGCRWWDSYTCPMHNINVPPAKYGAAVPSTELQIQNAHDRQAAFEPPSARESAE